jgi:DNA polymerase I-like protein with 3'-5' exonuclease and polymerase domains
MTRILVTDEKQLRAACRAIEQSSIICFDFETNGLDVYGNDSPVGVAFYCDYNDTSYYIPFNHGSGEFKRTTKTEANARKTKLTNERYKALNLEFEQLPVDIVRDALARILTTDKVYLAHNAMFDLTCLLQLGIDLQGATIYDTMLGARILYSGFVGEGDLGKRKEFTWFTMPDNYKRERGNTQLKWLARLFKLVEINDNGVGDETHLVDGLKDLKEQLGKNTLQLKTKSHLWALAPEIVAPYACMDVEITYQLHQTLIPLLDKWDNLDTYTLICEHQTNVAWRMQRNGFVIDQDKVNELLNEYEVDRKALLEIVPFNINSAHQIDEFAKSKGIRLPFTDKGNPKTDKETLKSYNLPEFNNAMKIKALDKNVKTYVTNWSEKAVNGVFHANFNVIGTVTGRWSGNMQQVPRNTEDKYSPKNLLLPATPEHNLVEIDYKQLEMRVGAWVAETLFNQEPILTNLIIEGVDLHAYTRDKAGICDILLNGRSYEKCLIDDFGYSPNKPEKLTHDNFMKEARQVAKVPNFAAMYGGGGPALTSILPNITEWQALEIMDGWKATYPTIVNAMNELSSLALTWRDVGTSKFQYIRYPENVIPFNRKFSYYDERQKHNKSKDAFNSAVQGTSGFITIESINRIIDTLGDKIIPQATVHDSFVFSILPEDLRLIKTIALIMCRWPIYPGLEVDVEIAPVGKAWGYKDHYAL